MNDKIDNQLYELQKQCNRYRSTDCLAEWVLFAVTRYINTGRATRQFEKDFIKLLPEQLREMIVYCLNRDKSDEAIIKSCKAYMKKNIKDGAL